MVAGGLMGCVVLTGCTKALFPETKPRSQYQAYDRTRGQDSPAYIIDEYGYPRPNLTGRLSPR